MSVHAFTSITPNYLPKARVLAHSVKRHLPDCTFHLQLIDSPPDGFDLAAEPFDSIIGTADLGLPNPDQWLFKHSVVEACTGVKGFGLKKILALPDCSCVFYFDPDMVLLAPPVRLLNGLQKSDILLTPHLTQPETSLEAILDNEFSVLKHGIYNLGFLGVRNSEQGRRFAEWWADRLEHFCYDDIPSGLFTDQRWADLAPSYFDGIDIVRDPGYNVATWNLTHRAVEGSLATGFRAGDAPLCLYHFSGFDSGAQRRMLDKYGASMPALYELRDWYIAECDRLGQQELGSMPWSYNSFDNGEPITKLHRKRYREREDLQQAFPSPFSTADVNRSYYHWFEANDESKVSAAPAAQPQAEPVDPIHYRVCCSLCGLNASQAAPAVERLLARTFQASDLLLVGPASARPSEYHGLAWIEVPEESSHEQAFDLVLRSSGSDRDLIWVTAETQVPKFWDLRLAWTALRIPGVATVSPSTDDSETLLDVADQAAYATSEFSNTATDGFLPDCSFFHRGVLSELAKGGDRLRQLRYLQVTADHIRVRVQCSTDSAAEGQPVAHPEHGWRRRQLHVLHSWGGGLERWVAEYCAADRTHDNLVLKSVGTWGAFGQELHLYRRMGEAAPVQVWPLSPEMRHTAVAHDGYRAALAQIVEEYGIDAIIVSSLIGHSLDVLGTGLPTVFICHDFYPICPALNITFDAVCRTCTACDLTRCTESNPHNRFFRNVSPEEWIDLRREFAATMLRQQVRMIAPSPSVREHYADFLPELSDLFRTIPHGVRAFDSICTQVGASRSERLRVIVPGSLAPQKGSALLRELIGELLTFADVWLVGCGEYGREFERLPGVTPVREYSWEQLPALMNSIAPDVALLLSVVPETFSYTLREVMKLGIPPVATRIGSFRDFIEEGVTGFLVEPDPAAILARMRELRADRAPLAAVGAALLGRPGRSLADMIADFEGLLALPEFSGRAYFARKGGIPRTVSGTRTFQLMWSMNGDGFSERESCRATVRPNGGRQQVDLVLPAMRRVPSAIRLDLGDHPGFLELYRVEVRSAEGTPLWTWKGDQQNLPGERSGMHAIGNAGGLLLYFSDNDPHLILPVDSGVELPANGGTVSVEFRYPSLTEIAERSLERKVAASRDGEATGELQRQLLESKERVAALERSLSWRITAPLRSLWGTVRGAGGGG